MPTAACFCRGRGARWRKTISARAVRRNRRRAVKSARGMKRKQEADLAQLLSPRFSRVLYNVPAGARKVFGSESGLEMKEAAILAHSFATPHPPEREHNSDNEMVKAIRSQKSSPYSSSSRLPVQARVSGFLKSRSRSSLQFSRNFSRKLPETYFELVDSRRFSLATSSPSRREDRCGCRRGPRAGLPRRSSRRIIRDAVPYTSSDQNHANNIRRQ